METRIRPVISSQKDSQYTIQERRHHIDENRASIVGRNPILFNRSTSRLCSWRIGPERHNIIMSHALSVCEF